jgi:hypothetical protein
MAKQNKRFTSTFNVPHTQRYALVSQRKFPFKYLTAFAMFQKLLILLTRTIFLLYINSALFDEGNMFF